jgi:type IV pilus assembly protein PilY1
MFSPDVVKDGDKYVLLIGSGDREKPLRDWTNAYGNSNYFFMLKDSPTDDEWLTDESTNCGTDVMCLSSLLPIPTSATPSDADLATKKGWYISLAAHEQVVTAAITVFGTVTFSTHIPVPAAAGCVANLGTASVYNISYKNASAQNGTLNRSEVLPGGGLPPSPVAGMVTLDDGTTVPFCIGCDEDSGLQSDLPSGPSVGAQPKAVTYWYIHK